MRGQSRTLDQEIARSATRTHGVLTRAALLELGATPSGIDRRVLKGALHPVHRGVYRVGHTAPSLEATYLAAVLACGEGGLLSHHAAGFLFRLLKGKSPPPQVTARTERRVRGVRTHRSRQIHPLDASSLRGIPVTAVPRTLVDLAADLPEDDLARAVHEADVLHGTRPAQVDAAASRRGPFPGRRKLRRVLYGEVLVTLSKLEREFLDLLVREGLPLPVTNRPAGGRYMDCRWPERRLAVELDSYRYHHTRHAWEHDRRREREARARGDEFRRYTWADVREDPTYMLADLRVLLA